MSLYYKTATITFLCSWKNVGIFSENFINIFVKMEVREAGDGAACGEAFRPPQKKYSWAEVRQAVHDLRKELCSLSTMVPMAISFRKLSNGKMRIYFLRIPQHGWEVTLLYTDVTPSNQPSEARLV